MNKKEKDTSKGWGIRKKLVLADMIMALIPFSVFAYFLVSYFVLARSPEAFHLTVILMFSLWFSSVAYIILRQMALPLYRLVREVRKLSEGEFGSVNAADLESELGELQGGISAIRDRMKAQLKAAKQREKDAKLLNARMQKNLLTLSNLTGIVEMVNSHMAPAAIIDNLARKVFEELGGGFCAIFAKSGDKNWKIISSVKEDDVDIAPTEIVSFLQKNEARFEGTVFLECLSEDMEREGFEKLSGAFPGCGMIACPVKKDKAVAYMLLAGGRRVEFSAEDKEMLEAFVKLLFLVEPIKKSSSEADRKELSGVSSQEEVLPSKREAVPVTEDDLSEVFCDILELKEKAAEEVKKSVLHQTSCSLVLMSIFDLAKTKGIDPERADDMEREFAGEVAGMLPEKAQAAFDGRGKVLVLLPDTSKKSACRIADSIRDRFADKEVYDLAVGVSENPIDGVGLEELLKAAERYTETARKAGGGRIVSQDKGEQ